jgi:acyl transferase domain-containing protein
MLNEPIAVIGSGCRFPGGSDTPSKLWTLLKEPRDLLRSIPKDRFNVDAFYHPDGSRHGSMNVQTSYTLSENVRAWDAAFFNIKPHEADAVDPQHRLLLETVYEALCAAGLKIEDLQGSDTAMYCGLMCNDYSDFLKFDLEATPTYAATGTSACILSNRVSYFFDWHGPSVRYNESIWLPRLT